MIKYTFSSNNGPVTLISENEKIVQIILQSEEIHHDLPNKACLQAEKEILEYFTNSRTEFTFPIEFSGSQFRKDVLRAMMKIPYGKTWNYSELAKMSGHMGANRAVGTVCKYNPLPLIIPCHRVVRKSGDIGEFYGGRSLKQLLLDIEKKPSKN